MSKIKWKPLIFFFVITFAFSALSGILTRNNMSQYKEYNLPILAPPSWLFPVVWTILYILMAISAYLIYTSDASKKEKTDSLFLYFLQLIINFFWSIIFFNLNQLFIGFLWIVLLWVIVIFMMIAFHKIKPIAAYLQIPYLLWISFAAYLNLQIYFLNK